MNELMTFITENFIHIFYLTVSALVSYLTFKLKKIITKYYNDDSIKHVVYKTVIPSGDVILNDEEKYNKIKDLLTSKNINCTDDEIKELIDSICNILGDAHDEQL